MAAEVKLMDSKKQEQGPLSANQANSVKKVKILEWVEGLKQEVRTINWTSKEELRVYTQIVVGATFLFGMGVYFVDLLIHGALNALTWVAHLLVG